MRGGAQSRSFASIYRKQAKHTMYTERSPGSERGVTTQVREADESIKPGAQAPGSMIVEQSSP